MKRTLPLLIIVLIMNACAPMGTAAPIPSNTSAPVDTALPTSGSPITKVSIADKYTIEIPEGFTFHENLSSATTIVPIYRIEASNGASFDVVVHPYIISPSLVPGKCVVSTEFDAGGTSAPIFCEGQELTDLFTISEDRAVKYGRVTSDLSLLSGNVSPETRYSTTYVFVLADKSRDTILEFYAGDAFRGPTNEMDGFEGLGAVLYNSIIPSLAIKNP